MSRTADDNPHCANSGMDGRPFRAHHDHNSGCPENASSPGLEVLRLSSSLLVAIMRAVTQKPLSHLLTAKQFVRLLDGIKPKGLGNAARRTRCIQHLEVTS